MALTVGKPEKGSWQQELKETFDGAMKVVTFLFVLGVSAFVLYAIDWDVVRSTTITDYSLTCSQAPISGQCPKDAWRQGDKIVYVVHLEQQTVTSQKNNDVPDKYDHCAVVDKKNWKCDYPGTTFQFGFKQGEYWTNTNPNNEYFKNVSRWNWVQATAGTK